MVKTIRLFIIIICGFMLTLTATVGYTERPAPKGSSSHPESGDSRRLEEQAAIGEAQGGDRAAACPICVDPCALKQQVEKGLLKIKDARGNRIEKFWVIDARPGIHQPCTERADTYYVGSPRTRVYIINMNPFIFDYEITKLEENVPETAQITFLKLLGTPLSDAIGTGGTGASTSAKAESKDDKCPENIKEADNSLDENSFNARMAKLEDDYKKFQTAYEGTRAAYTALLDRWATCQELCTSMSSYKYYYTNLPDKYEFEDVALKVIKENNRLVRDFKAKFPDIDACPGFQGSALQEKLDRMKRRVEILNDKMRVLCNNLFKGNRAKLAAMDEAIDTVRKHPDLLLTQTFDVGGYPDATKVKITVEPKEKQLTQTLPQDIGEGPQPCAGDSGGQSGQQQGQTDGGETGPKQPVITASPNPTPSP